MGGQRLDWRLLKESQVPYQLRVHVVDVDCQQLCVYFLKNYLGKSSHRRRTQQPWQVSSSDTRQFF